MRSAIINRNSSMNDVREQLTGVWNEYDTGESNKYHVVKTPFFTVISATLEKGSNMLPIAPKYTAMLHWVSKDNSGSLVIKAGETVFVLPENAVVEVTYWGRTA